MRSIAWDLDSTDLLLRLGSAEGRPLRRLAAKVLAARVADKLRAQNHKKKRKLAQLSKGHDGSAAPVATLPPAMTTTTDAAAIPGGSLGVTPVATTVSAMAASLESVTEEAKYKDVPAVSAVVEDAEDGQSSAGKRTGVAMMPGFAAKEARRAAWASKMVQILVRK